MEDKKIKKFILGIIIVLIALIAGVISYQIITQKDSNQIPSETSGMEEIPEEELPEFFCPICGEKTFVEGETTRRPLVIVIENHSEARPQSGLEKACLVYETVAEGGITRFLAFYLHNDCGNIGPVRSAREYFVEWAKSFEALFSYCGGSPTAFKAIKQLDVVSLNQFFNGKAYWRIKARKAPHNLYTSTEKLWNLAKEKEFSLEFEGNPYLFKDDIHLTERPKGQRIVATEIDFSGKNYKVRYEYEKKTNFYKRFLNGSPHIDNNSGNQLKAKNIAVMFTSIKIIDEMDRRKITTIGSGKALVFLDGDLIESTWKRFSKNEPTRFYDQNGEEIKFNRGQIWIEVISPDRKVSLITADPLVTTTTP